MISDNIWQVMKETVQKYQNIDCGNEHRQIIEKEVIVTPFEGGVFVSKGNEFDLFVLPEKRGKWNIKAELSKFFDTMFEKYDTLIVGIDERNLPSLRLAKFFGFQPVDKTGTLIRLEKRSWDH